MSKFFVEESQLDLANNKITICGEDVNHIKNVLRISNGEQIEIGIKSDNPRSFISRIDKINQENIICSIIEEVHKNKESKILLSIFQGLPKSDKMELIIQKCTEIGAHEFVPLELKRCIVKLEGKDSQKKIVRWQKIAEVAAKQCARDKIPYIKEKINIKQLCEMIKDYDCVIVAYEKENKNMLKDILVKNRDINKIAIVIGPEGGFDEDEISILKNAGANIVSIGNRILRTETAPIVLSSIIMYELGDIGG